MTNEGEQPTSSEPSEEEKRSAFAVRSKELVHSIVSGEGTAEMEEELFAMPRDALIEAAWEGIANYWGPAGHVNRMLRGGVNEARDSAMEREKDYRLSLLTKEEYQQAVQLANNWLDENFSE